MITNIKNGEDLITIDFNLKQIRYLKDFEKHGEIIFIDISEMDKDILEYHFSNGYLGEFFNAVKSIIENNEEIIINKIEEMEILNFEGLK